MSKISSLVILIVVCIELLVIGWLLAFKFASKTTVFAQERPAERLQIWEIRTQTFEHGSWDSLASVVSVYKFQVGRGTPRCYATLSIGDHLTTLGEVPCE